MKLIILLIVASVLGILGEIACKQAVLSNKHELLWGLGGASCWGLAAFVWVEMYRLRSVADLVVIFNPVQAVLLALVGILLYQDPVNLRMAIAGVFAIISCALMF